MVTHARVWGSVMAIVVGGACQGKPAEPPLQSAPAKIATDLTPIVGEAGPLELLADDGTDHEAISLAAYQRLYGDYKAKHPDDHLMVIAEHFPPGLSKAARVGINLCARDHNVSWAVDGDAERGFTLVYDENANGDLRDDPRHPFTATAGGFELTITATMTDAESHVQYVVPQRMRAKAGKLFIQDQVIRRGTITLGERARPFILVANGGDFHFPAAKIMIDLDGDGAVGPFTEGMHDSPEMFDLFERTLNIGARSYDFAVDPLGRALTLTPRATALPPRPALTVGTPAPELAGTDLEGQPTALSRLRGKTVLLDFWSPWCGPCRQAMPKLADLYKRRHAEGLDILSIIDGERADAVQLLGAPPYPGHEVLDAKSDDSAGLGLRYRVISYPTYFIVDPDGKIACARCALDDVLAKLDRAPDRVPSGT